MNDFNKRTNTLIYKKYNLAHFIFEREMFVVCEKWVETRMDFHIDPSSSSTIAALLPHLGWVAQTLITEGPKPSVWSWFLLRHPVSNWLEPSGHLVILWSNVHLLPQFFRLCTLVHLLIDGSDEGQYITQVSSTFLSTLAYLNNIVVWMVSTCNLISKFSSACTNPLGISLVHQLKLVSPSPSCSKFF